ncbi:hypothetical protein SKAU_G00078260 [Synaphobranchus kaupii]|uniref:Uncharacterized protein n=1 Tax=Synaphobranchus kaupii TaxID=118154 RepID=A0A9Q1FV52_SYNKA|nr:hypothetical protein SKAU_G00078260 [Synaphobranchus kaupii]
MTTRFRTSIVEAMPPPAGQAPLPALVIEGDITPGGLFSFHDSVLEPDLSFTCEPDPTLCAEFNFRTFKWMQTMISAIEEINRDGHLLPNVTPEVDLRLLRHSLSCSLGSYNPLSWQDEGSTEPHCSPEVPVGIGDGGSTLSRVLVLPGHLSCDTATLSAAMASPPGLIP